MKEAAIENLRSQNPLPTIVTVPIQSTPSPTGPVRDTAASLDSGFPKAQVQIESLPPPLETQIENGLPNPPPRADVDNQSATSPLSTDTDNRVLDSLLEDTTISKESKPNLMEGNTNGNPLPSSEVY
jgi:hypothetical protein